MVQDGWRDGGAVIGTVIGRSGAVNREVVGRGFGAVKILFGTFVPNSVALRLE